MSELSLIACVAWRFWLLSNKGGRGQKNREEIGAGATEIPRFFFFSRLRRSFSRASRANFAATPLVCPARQNRHATQAISLRVIALPSLVYSIAGFELDSEQDELRKALLIKQETDFDFLLLLFFSNS